MNENKKRIGDDKEWFEKMSRKIDKNRLYNDARIIAILHDIFDDGYSLGYNTAQQELRNFHKKLADE